LQIGQLISGVVHVVDFGESLQPGLAALLPHDPVRSPGRQRIIEAFVCGTHRLLVVRRISRVVEARQVTHSVVRGGRHHPRVAAFTGPLAEAVVVLIHKGRGRAHRCRRGFPIDGRIRQADIEVRDHWLPVNLHVCGRRKIGAFNVLEFADQCLLRRAPRTGVPLDRALIDHDGKGESGMAFCSSHDQLSCMVYGITGAVPIDDRAVDAPTYHVINLTLYLLLVRLAVTDVHVVGLAEPKHHMSVNFCRSSGIKKSMNINFADVSCSPIVVGLSFESVSGAGVVGSLSG